CIGPTALYGTSVKKLTLGSNLSAVGYLAFLNSDITELEFEDGNHTSFFNERCPFLSSKAFVGMKIKELKLPKWQDMNISDCVVSGCTELERVVFPDVPYIRYAYNSTYAYISSMWGIYGYFFMDCPKLKEVVCLGAEPLEINDLEDFATRKVHRYNDCQTFEFMDNIDQCVLKVPAGSEEKYRNHPIWGKFKTIYGFENGDYTSISNEAKFDTGNNEPEEYFNLQGMKVSNPKQGNIYIHRQGAKVEKVAL
ncbi:MAG: leucine-rich repeat domain-containing protein, partial [Paramuribaculum sp.]|nr:leucine-rich repeat domain-containing protein [Paramuribaculum sp.]